MIGGVVGLALFGALGWWLHKKRRDQKAAAYAQTPIELHAGEKPVRYAQYGGPGTAELDARVHHELDGSGIPAEADGRPIKK